jgi:hypothetical protein
VIDVGHGRAMPYPGGYEAFLWRQKELAGAAAATTSPAPAPPLAATPRRTPASPASRPASSGATKADTGRDYAARKRDEADQRKKDRARKQLETRIAELEGRVTEAERAVKLLEAQMADPAFYTRPDGGRAVIDEHQSLMWTVGELLGQWETLTAELEQNRQ